jgi:hypothetical protein
VIWQKFADVSEVFTASDIKKKMPLMIEAEIAFETSVNFYQLRRGCNPKDSHLYKYNGTSSFIY